jgi:hypothetical protein
MNSLFKIWISIDCQISKTKKKKNTCFSHSLSSSMCCCLCASNEEILYFHLLVSVSSIAASASISSGRTRKRTQKFSSTCYSESTKWMECWLFFFFSRTFEIIIMYMSMSVLELNSIALYFSQRWVNSFCFHCLIETNIIIIKSRAIGHLKKWNIKEK